MNIIIGQQAPNFIVNDIWGNEVNLSQNNEQKTVLSFFRFADCPMCNMRIAEIMRNKHQLKDKNIRLIAIFESPAESIKHSIVERHQFDFTIIADPTKKLYSLYNVKPSWLKTMKMMGWNGIKKMMKAQKQGFNLFGKMDGQMHQIPADFLIDTNGKIEMAYYGSDISDHLPLNELLK